VAVKLRLMRMGKTKQPTYRLVAADSRSPRDGRFIEILGVYAPRGRSTADPSAVIDIDNDKVLRWLKQGAQPTDRVERLLKTSGAWDTFRGVAPTAPAPSGSDAAAVSATEGAK
jgi:small subunit ribosomal protein S16